MRNAGGANAAWTLGKAASGQSGMRGEAAGAAGVASAGAASVMQGVRDSVSRAFGNPGQAFDAGARAAFTATGGRISGTSASSPNSPIAGAPQWAERLRREQGLRDAGMTATHVIASGDRGGSADAPRLRDEQE